MKLKSKKVLVASLASALCLGVVSPTTANAIQVEHKFDLNDILGSTGYNKYSKITGNYSQGVRFKLRSIRNPLHKDWWELRLVVRDGKLKLEGPTNIPNHLTIDDNYSIRVYDRQGILLAKYILDYRKPVSEEFENLKHYFNSYAPTYKYGYITIAGEKWNDTVSFYSKVTPGQTAIKQTSNNDYVKGYNKVNRFRVAFKITDEGLVETPFIWSW